MAADAIMTVTAVMDGHQGVATIMTCIPQKVQAVPVETRSIIVTMATITTEISIIAAVEIITVTMEAVTTTITTAVEAAVTIDEIIIAANETTTITMLHQASEAQPTHIIEHDLQVANYQNYQGTLN